MASIHKSCQRNAACADHLTDVTLVSDDKKQFKAHKFILSSQSSVLKSIISDLPQSSPVIYLRGIHHQHLQTILKFIYLGATSLNKEDVNEFFEA